MDVFTGVSSLENAIRTLHDAEDKVKVIISKRFNEAVSREDLVSMLLNFFPSLLTTRPNKLEFLYLAITFQSSLTFAGNTRSLPKKEASERCSNWVVSGLALKF
jgi:hypothetical protein